MSCSNLGLETSLLPTTKDNLRLSTLLRVEAVNKNMLQANHGLVETTTNCDYSTQDT